MVAENKLVKFGVIMFNGSCMANVEFIGYVKRLSQEIGGKTLFKNDVSNNFVIPKIGFSDDDLKNIEKVKEFLSAEFGKESPVQTYLTKSNIKTRY